MSPGVFSFLTTVLLGPVAALVGGVIVAWSTQDYGAGVIAGIAGLAAGLVVSYVITGLWVVRWPTEYDDVSAAVWERAKRRDDEWESKSHSRIEEWLWVAFFTALYFGGTVTALVATLGVGWLLAG